MYAFVKPWKNILSERHHSGLLIIEKIWFFQEAFE